jgi:glycosyltransferase involved in cell wall biosynthesis
MGRSSVPPEANTIVTDVPPPEISVVVCTYNGAERLPAVLDHLAAQEPPADLAWEIVLVDNASTDGTRAVAASVQTGALPSLRYIYEAAPGLTPARQCGVRASRGAWIAYVDDDNLLEQGWLAAIRQAIRDHPDAGGIGGEIVLDWPVPPPGYLRPFGFCFAEQTVGPCDRQCDNLAGAGMVLKREALLASGWLDQPLLGDRTGDKLVSGGDVEIAQRVRAAGYNLWLTPAARLRHRIPDHRMSRSYLFRINFELGVSSAMIGLLTWPSGWTGWRAHTRASQADWRRKVRRGLADALRRRRGLTEAIAWASFARGYNRGIDRCLELSLTERGRLLGAGDTGRAPAAHPRAA